MDFVTEFKIMIHSNLLLLFNEVVKKSQSSSFFESSGKNRKNKLPNKTFLRILKISDLLIIVMEVSSNVLTHYFYLYNLLKHMKKYKLIIVYRYMALDFILMPVYCIEKPKIGAAIIFLAKNTVLPTK